MPRSRCRRSISTFNSCRKVESLLDREYTNLAGAMQRAMAMFPHDAAKRIVLVTDGNQNIGDALEQARAIADAGVSIDVMPVPLDRRSEVAVEKVALPPDVRRGQPFELRVVLNNTPPTRRRAGKRGERARFAIVRKAGEREETLADEPHRRSSRARRVFPFRARDRPARFLHLRSPLHARRSGDDALAQNNLATAFTHVRGKGQVLLIENWENAGRVRLSGRAAAQRRAGSRRAAEQSAVHVAAGVAAVRHGDPGRRAARQRRGRGQREQLFATSRSRCWCATPRSWAAG